MAVEPGRGNGDCEADTLNLRSCEVVVLELE